MVKLSDIVKTNNIVKISPDSNLSHALSQLRTSHDAGFVFTGDDRYLGVINPYYCLIKSSYPGNAKAEHCIFHAPRIKINDSLKRVASLLTESKVHYLPVFNENDKFVGIISARHLLNQFSKSELFKTPISEYLKYKNKPVVIINEEENISIAINLFKHARISKLVVINKMMKLKGILSYFDLISYLVSPKNSQHKGAREGNHLSFYNQKIKNFAKTYVITLTSNYLLSDALSKIIEKKIGSIVIVDNDRHPIGIITTKDLLTFVIKSDGGRKLNNRQIIGGFFNNVVRKLRRN